MKSKTKTPTSERLFVGCFPTGFSFADRSRERHGDYVKLARIPYTTLEIEWEKDCPAEFKPLIEAQAADLRSRRGESYPIAGNAYAILGGDQSLFAGIPASPADSVEDFLRRYYRPERFCSEPGFNHDRPQRLIRSYEEDYRLQGWCIISRHDNITGQVVIWRGKGVA